MADGMGLDGMAVGTSSLVGESTQAIQLARRLATEPEPSLKFLMLSPHASAEQFFASLSKKLQAVAGCNSKSTTSGKWSEAWRESSVWPAKA